MPNMMNTERDIGNSEMNTADVGLDEGNLAPGGGHASMALPYHGNVEDVNISVPVPEYE